MIHRVRRLHRYHRGTFFGQRLSVRRETQRKFTISCTKGQRVTRARYIFISPWTVAAKVANQCSILRDDDRHLFRKWNESLVARATLWRLTCIFLSHPSSIETSIRFRLSPANPDEPEANRNAHFHHVSFSTLPSNIATVPKLVLVGFGCGLFRSLRLMLGQANS